MIDIRRIHRVREASDRTGSGGARLSPDWSGYHSLGNISLRAQTHLHRSKPFRAYICRSHIIIIQLHINITEHSMLSCPVAVTEAHSQHRHSGASREAYVRRVHSSPAERADSQLRIESNRGPTNPERLHLHSTHSTPPTPSQGPISSSASIYTESLRQGSAIGKDQVSSGSRRKGENTASLPGTEGTSSHHLASCLLIRSFGQTSLVRPFRPLSLSFLKIPLYGPLSGRSSSRVHGSPQTDRHT